MNEIKYTIKPDPDALDLTNRPQHLLSPSIENEDDDEEDYFPSEDEKHLENLQETSEFLIKVISFIHSFIRSLISSI